MSDGVINGLIFSTIRGGKQVKIEISVKSNETVGGYCVIFSYSKKGLSFFGRKAHSFFIYQLC